MRKRVRRRWEGIPPTPPARPVRILVVAAFAALALSACQEPAGVGLGLINEVQFDPSASSVALGDLDTLSFSAPAIGFASAVGTNDRPQFRVLVGDVLDPVFGDVRAVAYVDALQPAAAQALEADEVLEVWLELPRTYTYGDTTATLPVSLHQIQGSWDASVSYAADTVFSIGAPLATTTIAQADSLVRLNLPASWVTSNAATLVGDNFGDDFEGFALQAEAGFAPSPGAVFGLGTISTRAPTVGLRVATAEDTLLFPLSEVFTSIAGQPPTAPSADIIPLRRGTGSELRFTADSLSAFGPIPLARGMLRLPLNTDLAASGTFVRPLAARSVLFGVRDFDSDDPTYVVLGIVTAVDGQGVLVDTRTLTLALQNLLIDPEEGGFDRYEIRPEINRELNPASLDILPVLRPVMGETASRGPRLTLTIVGAPA